ncbi:branched-chain amino acid transporter AzlC [Oceanicola sp. 22II-s10i]|uniref:AzlC family ABC transporter permease n=1 Tax=Oceanicola sp. 22II-s10i TaxID=1317116 RepID=UPI000B52672A|nr:AzlC family ABC transporter permease [Oceanicola sp. 22II-s10i]OWU85428.1 branched-chain amino acid transporter AzlC [Oceanicola sp. 22II-s10i]
MTSTVKSAYWKGFRDGAPFFLVVSPFALLFGVVATEAGLNVFEALAFSVAVIAGAAQFTALQLLQNDAPVVIALVSALAVNLRMAMYSASLTPWIGAAPFWQRAIAAYFTVDQTYACSIVAYEKNPEWTVPMRIAYFFGVMSPVCPFWYVFTIVGAMIGEAIPPEFGLDFAMPITFIAMIAPMLRSLPHLAACFTAVTCALLLTWMPLNLGLLVSGIAGMMAGAATEKWRDGHRAAPKEAEA